jgi:hypothetical protein
MTKAKFRRQLLAHFEKFKETLATDSGDWVVKGFIDIYRNIYTISVDTKVVSKIIELMLFPVLSRFASEHRYTMVLAEHQNHYPDISFIAPDNTKFALDLKSTYRTSPETANGFTLGAFTGYFRNRKSSKNITFPYEEYAGHFVLGTIYSRSSEIPDEQRVHTLDELESIVSVVNDFTFLLQQKWQIASNRPGSGNTKNIGSVKEIGALVGGKGRFAAYDEQVFDDYWINYLTQDMAKSIDSTVPYRNLNEYWKWRDRRPPKRSVRD